MALPKVSEKNTKKEILSAFNRAKKLIKTDDLGTNEQTLAEVKEIREGVANLTFDSIVTQISGVKSSFSDSLAKIETSMTTNLEKLEKVNKAIKLAEAELHTVHGIKADADTLQALEMVHQEKKIAFDEEMRAKKDQWAKQQTAQEEQHLALVQRLDSDHKRSEEKWSYDFERKKKIDTNEMTDFLGGLQKTHNALVEATEAELTTRQNHISSIEEEYKRLQNLEAAHPKELEEACQAAADKALKSEKTSRHFEVAALKKDLENTKTLYGNEISTQDARLQGYKVENESLRKQVEAASEKVQAIATEAVKAARPQVIHQGATNG